MEFIFIARVNQGLLFPSLSGKPIHSTHYRNPYKLIYISPAFLESWPSDRDISLNDPMPYLWPFQHIRKPPHTPSFRTRCMRIYNNC